MNFRLPAVLIGIVLGIVVLLLVLSLGDNKETTTDALASELANAGVKADGVDSVEFERADGATLLIVRTDKERNTWQIQKPISAKADPAKVLPVINALLRAKPIPYGELSSNPAVHGLDPPGLKVTLRQGAERSSTVNLGDVTMGGDKGVVFVTTSAQSKRPMAVRRSDLDALFREGDKDGKAVDLAKWTSDFRAPNVFPADSRAMGEDVTLLKLSLPNKKQELALSRAPSGGWKFDAPAGWGDADAEGDGAAPPDKFTGVNPLLRALANVSALAPGDFIDQPKDLKEYGLNPDNPDRIRVEMKTRDGQTVVAYFGKFEAGAAPPPLPGMPPHPPTGGKMYVQVEGTPGVIRASATNLGGLAAVITDPGALRDRNLLNVAAGKQVDGLDVLVAGQAPDKPTKLRKVGTEWKLYGGPNDPQKAFDPAVTKLVEVLTAKRTIKDFPAPNPANFAAVSATVYVWVDGFNPPADPKAEPAKKAEPVKLEFGRKEGETVYVRRTLPGGQANEFAVAAAIKPSPGATETVDVVQSVAKTRLDLLDQTLPTFSDTAAVRLVVTGANAYTLARDEKPDPTTKETLWRFVEPADKKGQVADTAAVKELLHLLATSQGAFGKFVDEGTGNPAEFGLAPPRLKVVVGLGDKSDNDRVYEFGRDATDPDKVYARFTGKAAIFTIQRRVFDRFAHPDLRDRLIFRNVPAARVNVVELTGWGGIALKFEKNAAGVWEKKAPTPDSFQLDPAKLNAFIEMVTKASVKSFEKGPPEAKHGFGDPKQNLQATFRWPGGAVALNLGATPDAGATYYGWSAWLPQSDPVFTIDGALFKPYKDGPGGFAK
ncbi:MAG: DUF4340 domain-containing protein [Planctomycetes bacterium]|nr:DUF4340 domain-containing protein [Planctomycetota bacterium]